MKQVPPSLRKELKQASAKGRQTITPEQRAAWGRKGWQARVRKAQQQTKSQTH